MKTLRFTAPYTIGDTVYTVGYDRDEPSTGIITGYYLEAGIQDENDYVGDCIKYHIKMLDNRNNEDRSWVRNQRSNELFPTLESAQAYIDKRNSERIVRDNQRQRENLIDIVRLLRENNIPVTVELEGESL